MRYLIVRVDGVGVQTGLVRSHDGVGHVRRDPAAVARLPPLARVVQHLQPSRLSCGPKLACAFVLLDVHWGECR